MNHVVCAQKACCGGSSKAIWGKQVIVSSVRVVLSQLRRNILGRLLRRCKFDSRRFFGILVVVLKR